MSDVVAVVTNLGFPIAACIMMMMYVRELSREHKEETTYLTKALNNNTIVLQKLCDKLDVERED